MEANVAWMSKGKAPVKLLHRITCSLALAGLGVGVCPAANAADYYVSPTGNDSSGTGSQSSPWKSISTSVSKISNGDTLHLQDGATFTENVYIGAGAGGTAASPKVITGSSSNRPAIQPTGTGSHALYIYNTAGLEFKNLRFIGQGLDTHTVSGVEGYVDTSRQTGLTFRNCEITGFGSSGLRLGGWGSTNSGFANVLVEDCDIHDNNGVAGMYTYAQYITGHTNVTVRRCRFYDNPGSAVVTNTHTGSGLVLSGITGGLVEYCSAMRNGVRCTTTGGPVGIWGYFIDRITFQFCESYSNRAVNCDGGGFDLDGGCRNCVIQYCYSHGNDGAGYLLCQYSGAAAFTSNAVRYCISENDGQRQTGDSFGGIHFYSAGSSGGIQNTLVYGNTVFSSAAPAVRFQNTTGQTGTRMWNNIFITTNGAVLVSGSPATNVALLQGNCYWSCGGTFSVAGYSSIAAWSAAKSQELLGGNSTALQTDPMLVSPGNGGTVGATNLLSLTAYKLQPTSPMIDHGLDLSALFGVSAGTDFYGTSVPQHSLYDVGAYESSSAVPSTPVAAFSAAPVSGTAPLAVTFDDTSTGSITNRYWDFGDGTVTNTTVAGVLHTYTDAGTYTVQLIVSSSAGSSTNTQADVIEATPAPTGGASVHLNLNSAYNYDAVATAAEIAYAAGQSKTVGGALGDHAIRYINRATDPQTFASNASAGSGLPADGLVDGGKYELGSGLTDKYGTATGSTKVNNAVAQLYNSTDGLLSRSVTVALDVADRKQYLDLNILVNGTCYGTRSGVTMGATIEVKYVGDDNWYSVWSESADITSGAAGGTFGGQIDTTTGYYSAAWNPVKLVDTAGLIKTSGGVSVVSAVDAYMYELTVPAALDSTKTLESFRLTATTTQSTRYNEFVLYAAVATVVGDSGGPIAGTDDDSDGIPNDWETQYFGGVTNANPNATAANGLNSVYECYVAGLDPTNAQSVFKLSASENLLQWNAVSGRVYSVYWTTNLLNGFQCLESNIVWPQSSWTGQVGAAQGGDFYKLEVQLVP